MRRRGPATVTQTRDHDDLDVGDATEAGLEAEINGLRSELTSYQSLGGVACDPDPAVVVQGLFHG
jgi:hypothetical protein